MPIDHSERWARLWDALRQSPPNRLLDELLARYRDPARHYHTLAHLDDCLRWLDWGADLAGHAAEVEVALWFHDAVYDGRRTDNEVASARWAGSALAGAMLPPQSRARIEGLILVTTHDRLPTTNDQRLMVDIDLSILGSPTPQFEQYEALVRREYDWVAEDDFRRARAAILTRFAARPFIYHTDRFRHELEAQARANLARSLQRLGTLP